MQIIYSYIKQVSYFKILQFSLLGSVVILFILFNNITLNINPHGSDEHFYMGASNRIAIFENKNLTVFYPYAAHLFSFILGKLSLYSQIHIHIIYRIAHLLALVYIVYSFYKFGSLYSKRTGLILSSLIVTFASSTFWLGPIHMVPSTFLWFIIPNVGITLISDQKLRFIFWILFTAFFYWWGLGPLVLLLLFFFLSNNKKVIKLFSLGILIFITLVIRFHYKADILQTLGSDTMPQWVFEFLENYLLIFFIAILGVFVSFKKEEMDHAHALKRFAISAIAVNLYFFMLISQHSQVRTNVFLFFGLYALIALTVSRLINFKNTRRVAVLYIVTFLVVNIPFTAHRHINDVFHDIQILDSEKKAVSWMQKNIEKDSFILSDESTMSILPYYLDNYNYRFVDHTLVIDSQKIVDFLDPQQRLDISHLDTDSLANKLRTKNIYFMISPRTCVWETMALNEKKITRYRETFFWYKNCTKMNESSLDDSRLVYYNSEVKLYKLY